MSKKPKKLVPELRFSEFEGDWDAVPLKILLASSIQNGYSPVCPDIESGSWVLSLSALNGNGFDPTQRKPAPKNDEKIKDFCLSDGDFLVSRSNTIDKVGRAALFRGEIDNCSYPDLMMRFRVNIKEVELNYLDYYLRTTSVRRYFQSSAAGSHASMVKITKSTLERTPVVLPKPEEQEKIASFLGAIATRLDQLRRKHALLQTYKRGVMQKLFSQEIRFKQPDGTPFPDWRKVKLGKMTNKIGSGATPRGGEDNYKKSGIALFRSMNVYDNYFQEEKLAFIDNDQARVLDNVTVEAGDILLNITGASIARCCLAPEKLLPARVNQHVMIIRPDIDKGNSVFLSNLLTFQDYKQQLFRIGGKGGSTREALTKFQIETFKVVLPFLFEQEKIANFLTSIDRKIQAISHKIEQTEQFKKGLLQKMFV